MPPAAANAAAPTSGRDLSEAHLRHCLKAGVRISGSSAASSPGQWSFKIGPCEGIDLADELWTSRYILQRLSEKAGKHVTFDPCPIPGDWSPAGCFVKFSTSGTRDPSTGLAAIEQQVLRLQASHVQHMIAYGQGSLNKLLSQDPNASVFSCAGANKAASVVVPSKTLLSRAGYYVDRRPSSNMDPYLVTMLLVASALDVPLPTGGAAPTAAVAAAASAPAASQPIPTPRHSGLAAAKLAQQQQLALAAAAGRGHSACSGLSYSHSDGLLSADADTRSMSSHQLLLDELYKRDGFAPDTPPMLAGAGFSACIESSDESCSSDGTSPERESPLGAALLHGDAEGMVY